MATFRNIFLGTTTLAIGLIGHAYAFESTRITVSASGSGSSVIFVPGLKSSPHIWDEIAGNLDGHQVHLVQVNGFAGLPAGDNATADLLPALADEIARYIGEESLDDVSIIGHSMGGTLATLVASRHPEAIDRLMTIDIPAYFGEIMGIPPEQIAPVAAQIKSETLALGPNERAAADRAFVEAGVQDVSKRELVLKDMEASDPSVAAQAQYEVMVTDLRPLLAAIPANVTVVYVKPAQMPAMSEDAITQFYSSQYAGASQLHLEFVEDSGHYVMLDQPENLMKIVDAFLAGS